MNRVPHRVPQAQPDPVRDHDADYVPAAARASGNALEPDKLEPAGASDEIDALIQTKREQERQLDARSPANVVAVWQPPQPLPEQRLLPVPPFDFGLLPVDFHECVQDVAERMQVAPDLPAVASIAALGIVAANARTVFPKEHDDEWREYPNLWGTLVAPSGSMKSPSIKLAEGFLDKLEEQERDRHTRRQLESEAGEMIADSEFKAIKARLDETSKAKAKGKADSVVSVARAEIEAALRKLEEEKANRPRIRHLKLTDTTVEALFDRVQRGKRRATPVIVWRDELMAVLYSFERDGHQTDRQVFMEGWTVTTTKIERVGRGSLFVKDFACSLFGCATPGALAPYVRETTAEGPGSDGFLQRMQLIVYPDPLPRWELIDRPRNRMAATRAFSVFERLYALDEDDECGKPPGLHFDEMAQGFFNEYLTELEYRLRDDRRGWDTDARKSHFSKYRGLMPKLALICHLASGPGAENQRIPIHAAKQAALWCDYLEKHAERVYAMKDRSIEQLIVEKIKSGRLTGELGVRDLHRRYFDQRDRKTEDVRSALEELEHLGWVRLHTQQTGGRPRDIAVINPMGAR